MKLFYKLSSTIALIVTFFLLPLTNAFADTGSFTVSNVVLDTGASHLDFDYTGHDFSNGTNFTCTQIQRQPASPNSYAYWSCTSHADLTCTSSHCQDVNMGEINALSNGDVVQISVFNSDNSFDWISSNTCTFNSGSFTCASPTPTPTGSVLAAYHINPTSQAKMGSMTAGATSSFLSLFEANWPTIVTLSLVLVCFFWFLKLWKMPLNEGGD